MLQHFLHLLVSSILELGYIGIFILMAIQNSIFPFAMELVLVPAGFLAYNHEMNLFIVLLSGIMGQVFGALCNYVLSYYIGEKVLLKFIKQDKLLKLEKLFTQENIKSVFLAFIMPGIRPYIALVAGAMKMNIFIVLLFAMIASTFWVGLVALLGFYIGEDIKLIEQYMDIVTIIFIIIAFIWLYFFMKKRIKE